MKPFPFGLNIGSNSHTQHFEWWRWVEERERKIREFKFYLRTHTQKCLWLSKWLPMFPIFESYSHFHFIDSFAYTLVCNMYTKCVHDGVDRIIIYPLFNDFFRIFHSVHLLLYIFQWNCFMPFVRVWVCFNGFRLHKRRKDAIHYVVFGKKTWKI